MVFAGGWPVNARRANSWRADEAGRPKGRRWADRRCARPVDPRPASSHPTTITAREQLQRAGSNPDAAGLAQLLPLLGIFAVAIFAAACIRGTLLRLDGDPVHRPAVRRLHPVPSARVRRVALRCRIALARPDGGHVHEQVIGDQSDGQVHDHSNGDCFGSAASVEDVKVGEPQDQRDEDCQPEEQPSGVRGHSRLPRRSAMRACWDGRLPQRTVPPDGDRSASPRPDAEMLLAQGGAALLGRQALRPVVSQVLPLAAAAEAHRILERRHGTALIRAHGGYEAASLPQDPEAPRGFLPFSATACAAGPLTGFSDRSVRGIPAIYYV
jgi:hypothetical protein